MWPHPETTGQLSCRSCLLRLLARCSMACPLTSWGTLSCHSCRSWQSQSQSALRDVDSLWRVYSLSLDRSELCVTRVSTWSLRDSNGQFWLLQLQKSALLVSLRVKFLLLQEFQWRGVCNDGQGRSRAAWRYWDGRLQAVCKALTVNHSCCPICLSA